MQGDRWAPGRHFRIPFVGGPSDGDARTFSEREVIPPRLTTHHLDMATKPPTKFVTVYEMVGDPLDGGYYSFVERRDA